MKTAKKETVKCEKRIIVDPYRGELVELELEFIPIKTRRKSGQHGK